MTPRARTNQLLYQAELLITTPVPDDEHLIARTMALEEGALATMELALDSLLEEVTEHALLEHHDWPTLLSPSGPEVAELQRLRDLAVRPESWLGWLIQRLEALHGSDGAARRPRQNPAMIAVGGDPSLSDQVLEMLEKAKADIASLRETSEEW